MSEALKTEKDALAAKEAVKTDAEAKTQGTNKKPTERTKLSFKWGMRET